MKLITTTKDLDIIIARIMEVEASKQGFVTVDTEFVRESTYYPKLCLIQIGGSEESILVDPLANGIDLSSLFDLMRDSRIVKVFHAARQDLEIFYYLMNEIPSPIFDTQIAAMVCGYGESVGYEALVNDIAKTVIDKSARYSNWIQRPLTTKQLKYALSDVIHLRVIYEKLLEILEKEERVSWIEEEMNILAAQKTYQVQEGDLWKKIKPLRTDPAYLVRLQKLAAYRECEAQKANCPRARMIRDEVIAYAALASVKSPEDLEDVIKRFQKGLGERVIKGMFVELNEASLVPQDLWPKLPAKPASFNNLGTSVDLLRVLLKAKSIEHRVAEKLIATTPDLEKIAALSSDAKVLALEGWRYEIFGRAALGVCSGSVGLRLNRKKVTTIEIDMRENDSSYDEE